MGSDAVNLPVRVDTGHMVELFCVIGMRCHVGPVVTLSIGVTCAVEIQ